jgi:hypothetical protein
MSSPRFAPGEIDIVEWLAVEVEKGTFGNMQLIVRPHPQNVQGNLSDLRWIGRLNKINELQQVAVDFPDLIESKLNWSMATHDMIRLANLLTGSSIVINSGSTVSIDGLIHGKPIIVTSVDGDYNLTYWRSAKRLIDYLHLKKLVDTGGVSVVNNYIEFKEMIIKFVNRPGYLIDKRLGALNDEIFMPDGNATSRVATVLTNN